MLAGTPSFGPCTTPASEAAGGWKRRLAAKLLFLLVPALWALGCGDSGAPLAPGPEVPTDPPEPTEPVQPAEASALLGSAGGTLTVGLPEGGTARLILPTGALDTATLIRLVALPTTGSDRARFSIEPAGLALRADAQLQVTLPNESTNLDAFVLRRADLSVTLETTRQGLTLSAKLRELALPPGSSPAPAGAPAARGAAATAEVGSAEVAVAPISEAERLAQLEALALKAITDPIAQAQLRLNLQLAAIAGSGDITAQVRANVQNILCEQYFVALRDLNLDPMNRLPAFAERALPTNVLAAAIQEAEEKGLMTGCTQGPVAPGPTFDSAGARYLDFLESRLASADMRVEFLDWWALGFQPISDFGAQADLLGISLERRSPVTDLIVRLFGVMRPVAFGLCTPDGEQTYSRLLIEAAIQIGMSDEIMKDIEYCATRVVWDVRTNADTVEAAGVLGRNDADFTQPTTLGEGMVRYGSILRLSGDVRAIRCQIGNSNDRLVLRMESTDIATLPNDGAGRLIPVDGFEISVDTLAVRAGLKVARTGSTLLTLWRVGSNCGRAASGEDEELASLFFQLSEGVRIVVDTLPNAAFEEEYDYTFTADNATGDVTWDLETGEMPFGLALSSDGRITGTAIGEADDVQVLRVRATDRNVRTSEDFTIRLRMPALQITTESIGDAVLDAFYTQTLFVNRPLDAPITWSISSGSLPAGLSLSQTGTISGTPTTAQQRTFTVRAAQGTEVATRQYTINVTAPPSFSILNQSFPDAVVEEFYSVELQADLPPGEGSWTISAGALPPGLSIGSTFFSSSIGGTPTTPGTYDFTLRLEWESEVATRNYTIQVVLAPLEFPAFDLFVPLGYASTNQLFFTGGSGTASWTLVSGPLPPGLALESDGRITGTATQEGSFPITVRVTRGSESAEASGTVTVVRGPLVIITSQVTITQVFLQPGEEFPVQRRQILVSGGNPPENVFTLVSGTLPPGIVLTSDGFIEGTNFSWPHDVMVRIRVTDGVTTSERDIRIVLNCCAG